MSAAVIAGVTLLAFFGPQAAAADRVVRWAGVAVDVAMVVLSVAAGVAWLLRRWRRPRAGCRPGPPPR